MKKKRIDQIYGTGMRLIASGYAMKARPAPKSARSTRNRIATFQARTTLDDRFDFDALLLRHESHDAENGEARKDARAGIEQCHEYCVAEAVVAELVVAGQRQQRAEAHSQRIEDLCRCFAPNLKRPMKYLQENY